MKKLFYLFALLAIISCGQKQGKAGDGNTETPETESNETADANDDAKGPFGKLPDIYGDAFERMTETQEMIQTAYKSGGSPSTDLMKQMIEIPKEAKAEATKEIENVTGNRIAVEGHDYGFVKISGAEVTGVSFSSNSTVASIEIKFIPDEGYDFMTLPKGSKVYYLCLTENNTVLYMNAMFFPSNGKTKIGLSANVTTKKKSSPAVWNDFAKIKFISENDFRALSSMR